MTNPDKIEIHLEMFEGPLDLLLHLIKENNLDIYDIPISQITKEYLAYLDLMKELNLELAGDFLIMASTLMQIKAKTLLPSHDGEEETGPDPREELMAKLLEYQKFKEAAKFLEKKAEESSNIYYRGSPEFAEDEKNLNISMFKLLATLREILGESADRGSMVVKGEEFPIETRIEKILNMLAVKTYVTFREIFKDEHRKMGILTCFLALLELIKLQKIFARQESPFGEILIYKKEAAPVETPPAESSLSAGDGASGETAGAPPVAQVQQEAN